MTTTDATLKKLKDAVAAATDKLRETEADLRTRYTRATRERSRVRGAYASREELQANARRLVERRGEQWRQTHREVWLRKLSGHIEWRIGETEADDTERTIPPALPALDAAGLDLSALCGLVPDALTAGLTALIAAQPDAAFGLPADARARRVADLDAEIADLARQHTELVDAAAAAGLTFPLLTPVREQREADALEQARAQALTEARAAHGYTAPAPPPVTGLAVTTLQG